MGEEEGWGGGGGMRVEWPGIIVEAIWDGRTARERCSAQRKGRKTQACRALLRIAKDSVITTPSASPGEPLPNISSALYLARKMATGLKPEPRHSASLPLWRSAFGITTAMSQSLNAADVAYNPLTCGSHLCYLATCSSYSRFYHQEGLLYRLFHIPKPAAHQHMCVLKSLCARPGFLLHGKITAWQ